MITSHHIYSREHIIAGNEGLRGAYSLWQKLRKATLESQQLAKQVGQTFSLPGLLAQAANALCVLFYRGERR